MGRFEKFLFYLVDTSHIQQLMNVKDRQARRKMKEVRDGVGKTKKHPVFLYEVLDHTRLPLEYAVVTLGWDKFDDNGSPDDSNSGAAR